MEKKTRKRKSIGKRLLSLLMALAMVITMVQLPGAEKVQAADGQVKLYFELPAGTNAGDWAVNVWGKGNETVAVTGGTDVRIGGTWKEQNKPSLIDGGNNWGYVTVSGNVAGLQFVQWVKDTKDETTEPTKYDCWNAQIATDNYTEAYFSPIETTWYKDSGKSEKIEASDSECVLTLNFKSSWEHAESYVYSGSDTPAGVWPGKSMTATPGHAGWYTVHLIVDNTKDYKCILNNKLNNTSGSQLADITLETSGKTDVEYWYDGTALTTEKPEGWKYNTTVHYLALNMGDTIYNHMWDGDSTIAGPGVGKSWPGELATKNAEHEGWYDAVYTQDVMTDFKCIFNNNSGTQTDDISVEVTSTNTEIWVTGTKADGNTTTYKTAPDTWEKAPEPYSFTMYYYNPNLTADDLGKVDLWMWNAGLNGSYVFTDTWYDADNDVTWFKQNITTTDDKIGNAAGLKARYDNTKGWDGGSDSDRSFTISGADNETWYYVDGQNPVSEKPVITPTAPRYFVLDYVNEGLYEAGVTPQFYSWSTGYAAELKDFTYVGDGKWTVTAPVKDSCAKVDYVIALDSKGDPWVKDGGDHSIAFPTTQRVVYAKMTTGGEPELAMPYNTGYKVLATKKQIEFYYRDDDAFVDGMLESMAVAVDINGTEYAMTYNDATKRYEYTMSGLESGKTYYRYKVGNEYVTDAFNANTENYKNADYSFIEYYKLNAAITAEVMNPKFNYNENNVVKFTVNQDSIDEKKFKVASATIDVSSLGGSSKLAIEPELQAVAISATTNTSLGQKTLPITVKDQYGNEYTTSVNVEVVKREKKNADDFDWDEAVIYFMVTDRFFDGNSSNNTASGADTYGNNEGLYHGGDFAGVTAKLNYLQELGVNTIWITPIVENIAGVKVSGEGKDDVPYNAAYHGYWAKDFTKLNPTLGTTTEFQTMIDEAHKRGIRIMVDIVINHAGYGTEASFTDMIRDKSINEGDILSWQSGMPDFATEKADVRTKLVEWQTSWMKDYGVDYFRVDTVKHVESTTWAALKNSTAEVNPSFKMIGEYYGAGYAANGGTLGTGQMDADLDFDMNDQASAFVGGNMTSVEKFLEGRNKALNNTYMTGQFLSSHDEEGFKQGLLNKGMTKDDATAASLVAATLQITAKGQPVIYYGEEIGLTGLNNYPYQTNRYDFDWSLVSDSNTTYNHYKKMLAIRNANTEVFARGDRKSVAVSDKDGYDVVSRSYNGTKLYVGMNIKAEAQTVAIPVSESNGTVMKDLYSEKTYTVSNGTVNVSIPAAKDGGTVVLKRYSTPDGGSSSDGGSGSSSNPSTGKDDTTTPTTPDDTTVTTNPDGTTTETKTETTKNDAGNEVTITITTEKDADGNVTGSKEVSVIAEIAKNTSATVTVEKDAAGNITSAKADVALEGTKGKTNVTGTISGGVVSQIVDSADTKNVQISVTVAAGDKEFTVKVDAEELTAGAKLKVVAIDSKTKKYVLVNAKTYTVSKDGDVKVSLPTGKTYELVTGKEASTIEKQILNTVKVKKSSATVKKGKKTTLQMSSKLDMQNVSKITYTSSKKSVATVNKDGKVTAQKAGTATVKAKVTLMNGKTKTVTMKIKVK